MKISAREPSPAAPVRPVAVGGVGGSGTRVVAEILKRLGYFVGDDLNDAHDNLWFTLLFKYREVRALSADGFTRLYGLFRSRMLGVSVDYSLHEGLVSRLLDVERAGQHDHEWLAARCASFLQATDVFRPQLWGWKEPNTHMVIDRLAAIEPGLRYVHVMRNGLDMAFSSNQNQLRLWGPMVLGERFEDSPRGSLAFWRWAHERILEIGQALGDRLLMLNFDRLCSDREKELRRLLDFLALDPPDEDVRSLASLIKAPGSIDRYRASPSGLFDPTDVAFVRTMGFATD